MEENEIDDDVPVFMSADYLGITESEREGLLWLTNEIIEGRIVHADYMNINAAKDGKDTVNRFNMSVWEVGNTRCIAGWLSKKNYFTLAARDDNGELLKSDFNLLYTKVGVYQISPILRTLLFPEKHSLSIQIGEACRVILNFLETGIIEWKVNYTAYVKPKVATQVANNDNEEEWWP